MGADAADLVRRAIAAFENRDAETFAECFAPDAEFLLPRNLFEGGSYRGHAGLRKAVDDAYETWREFKFRIDEIEEAKHGIVIQALVINTPGRDGPPVEYQAVYGCRAGERGITYWRPYESREEALAALGRVG